MKENRETFLTWPRARSRLNQDMCVWKSEKTEAVSTIPVETPGSAFWGPRCDWDLRSLGLSFPFPWAEAWYPFHKAHSTVRMRESACMMISPSSEEWIFRPEFSHVRFWLLSRHLESLIFNKDCWTLPSASLLSENRSQLGDIFEKRRYLTPSQPARRNNLPPPRLKGSIEACIYVNSQYAVRRSIEGKCAK